MNQRHITEGTMRVRDAIYSGLLIRQGLVLSEEVARERANNLATAVMETLAQLAEESKPPPVRVHQAMQDAPHDGEPYRMARAAIREVTEVTPAGLKAFGEVEADRTARAVEGQDVLTKEST